MPLSGRRRIRVLFVSRALDIGGAERFVSTVLSNLDSERFELHLVLFRNLIGYPLPDHVPVTVLDRAEQHRWWHILRFIIRLARTIRRTRPDVVVSAYSYPNIVTGFALRFVRGETMWLARVSTNPEWEDTWLRRRLFRLAYRRADRFVANSEGLGSLFSTIYTAASGRIWHVPNPADFGAIEAAVHEPPEVVRAERYRLVAVGRLAPQKRIDLLIAAVDQLRHDHDIELVVCGDGPLRSDLESLVDSLGVRDHVNFVGYGNPFPWLSTADIFVLASDHEGSPNALIEAQGLGIPAVSTDCAFGPSEILENGITGRLVPVGEVEGLVSAIDEAINDPEWRAAAGKAARRRARGIFDAATVTELFARHLVELHGYTARSAVDGSDPVGPRSSQPQKDGRSGGVVG